MRRKVGLVSKVPRSEGGNVLNYGVLTGFQTIWTAMFKKRLNLKPDQYIVPLKNRESPPGKIL